MIKKIIIILFLVAGAYAQTAMEFPLAFTDTTSTAGDTLSRRLVTGSNTLADTCKQYQIYALSCSANIYFSSSPSFPAKETYTFDYTLGALTDQKWYSAQVSNWYYKAVTGSGVTVNFKIKCWGQQ